MLRSVVPLDSAFVLPMLYRLAVPQGSLLDWGYREAPRGERAGSPV